MRVVGHAAEKFDPAPLSARLDLVLRNRRFAEMGRKVVEETTYEFQGFGPVRVDLLSDWMANPFSHRSWQWHSSSFNFMPWLLAYYGSSGQPRIPEFALCAVASWRQAEGQLQEYEFSRHDHATALRAENALLLLAYLRRFDLCADKLAWLADWIDGISALLESPDFYSRHTNHGVEQARILATSAFVLCERAASPRRWELAMGRLADEFAFAFTHEGVHVENSPGYHVFVCNAFLKVAEMFPRGRLGKLGEAIDDMVPKAMSFLAHILRPDGRLPIIGDTEAKVVTSRFPGYHSRPEWGWLSYAQSGGLRGKPPAASVAAFPESGYLVVRDRWRTRKDFRQSMHLVMKSGCLSRYHRHDDDLNIILYWGEDWLVDGGAYSYVETSDVRRYLRSKWAHNVPVIDGPGERWAPIRRNLHRASLVAELEGDGRVSARAETKAYPAYRATRALKVDRGRKGFLVEDYVEPDTAAGPVLFRSLWHVPIDKDVYRRNQSILIVSRSQHRAVKIRVVGPKFGSVGRFVPTIEGRAGTVSSPRTNELLGTTTISFNKRSVSFESALRFDLLEKFDTQGWQPL